MNLKDIIGEDQYLSICQQFPGRSIYIAEKVTDRMRLMFGVTNAEKVTLSLGGQYVYIPSSNSIESKARAKTMSEMIENGASSCEIASETGLSLNWINKSKKGRKNGKK